jgi:hypothetical protein
MFVQYTFSHNGGQIPMIALDKRRISVKVGAADGSGAEA